MLLLTRKSDLSTAVLLPQLLTPAYLIIQLLTLVIPITCLYSLHLPLIYIETSGGNSQLVSYIDYDYNIIITNIIRIRVLIILY